MKANLSSEPYIAIIYKLRYYDASSKLDHVKHSDKIPHIDDVINIINHLSTSGYFKVAKRLYCSLFLPQLLKKKNQYEYLYYPYLDFAHTIFKSVPSHKTD